MLSETTPRVSTGLRARVDNVLLLGANGAPVPSCTVAAGILHTSGISAFVLSCQMTTSPSCIIDEMRAANSWGWSGLNQTVAVVGSTNASVYGLFMAFQRLHTW